MIRKMITKTITITTRIKITLTLKIKIKITKHKLNNINISYVKLPVYKNLFSQPHYLYCTPLLLLYNGVQAPVPTFYI